MNKKAVLLVNLGSPDSYEVKDVRNYLNEFLMDEKVIDMPYLPRLLLVRGMIVPFRAPKSAEKYKSIWEKTGSPQVYLTEELTKLVGKDLNVLAYTAMRYGNPETFKTFERIKSENPNLEELSVVLLYPHYAMSSYETAYEKIMEVYNKGNYKFKLKITPPFYNDSNYISALSESMAPYLEKNYDHILFSYHGIPQRHVEKTDVTGNHCLKSETCCEVGSEAHAHCYRHQVIQTTKLVAQKLNIPSNKFSYSFQSRLGRDKWLLPFTVERLQEMPKQGIKNLVIASPSFVIDCLETLEEINMEGRDTFMKAGGESFTLIPCLNLNPGFVKTINSLVNNL